MRAKSWLDIAERGSASGMWFLVVLGTLCGRPPAQAFVRILALYYFLTHPVARHSSLQFQRRVKGRASLGLAFRNVLRFAQCTLDRLFFVQGKVAPFEVRSFGEEHIRHLLESRRGAILLGAHLGSFEALQRMADAREIPVNIVGYFKNAEMINSVLRKLNPRSTARLIELDPEGVDFMLKIRELLEAGELVSILADRVGPKARAVTVDFFGQKARFPAGPFVLASVLGCPVYLTLGLYFEPNRYDLYCELLAEQVRLPRKNREQALAAHVQRYAERLEHYCQKAPDNWFNFFDFWDTKDEGQAAPDER